MKKALEEIIDVCSNNESSMESLRKIERIAEDAILSTPEAEYWKKRCEAAEENIKTYSDWNTDRLDVDRMSSTSDVLFLKWKNAFDNWQQLKNQSPLNK